MFKNTKWRDLIPILWIYFIHQKSIRKTQLTTRSLVCFFGDNRSYFSWFRKVDIWRRKCRASRTKFRAAYLFAECLIIFVGHFLKNQNRYLNYMKKIYTKNFQVYIHWHWSSSEKSSFFKPIASVFSPPPVIVFSYVAEKCSPLVQLIGM